MVAVQFIFIYNSGCGDSLSLYAIVRVILMEINQINVQHMRGKLRKL